MVPEEARGDEEKEGGGASASSGMTGDLTEAEEGSQTALNRGWNQFGQICANRCTYPNTLHSPHCHSATDPHDIPPILSSSRLRSRDVGFVVTNLRRI